MNVLYLYNSNQTYTSTVYEHLASFDKYSKFRSFFAHLGQHDKLSVNLSAFDAIVIHYSIRLSFDQIEEQNMPSLSQYDGLKVLFLQDEYDHTYRIWSWIKRIGIQLVFTVVPTEGIAEVYPPAEFLGVRFVNTLTGYVPEELPPESDLSPSRRQVMVGYRGRHLPVRYGQLGFEKVGIGKQVKEYCSRHQIPHNIDWSESSRIYGSKWYEFVSSCRATLGSESGSNVFDWDGSLASKIENFKQDNPKASEDDIYRSVIEPLEVPGLMNQVSPRIFEAIALRTVLVLFEGQYSGVVVPDKHYIPLAKDCSNLDEVFRRLADRSYVDTMAECAYDDIIASGQFSYKTFVDGFDHEVTRALEGLEKGDETISYRYSARHKLEYPLPVTTSPVRAVPVPPPGPFRRAARYLWQLLPLDLRMSLRARIKTLIGKL